VRISHQFRHGLGAFVPLPKGFGVSGEMFGATSVARAENGNLYSPLEGLLSARWLHRIGLSFNVGGGAALVSAPGAPQYRLFASIFYLRIGCRRWPRCEEPPRPPPPPASPDPDRDGLIGATDRCPRAAGPAENLGCPDRDSDGDAIVDRLDGCPREAGVRANNGCPDRDRDADGLADRLDRCPSDPGDPPSGCPERKYIIVRSEKSELKEKVLFATNQARVAAASFGLLDEVVEVLRQHPSMALRIEGHTDSRVRAAGRLGLAFIQRCSAWNGPSLGQ
jgi:outer membrane protein OmpA-like peptidoglycan-associated protein